MDKEIWVFLSHSHEDYEKVRKIRDLLEDIHMHPLMFFLKCLNDHDEIDSLIKREVDCRTRFILCDSENARKSKWVKDEVEYIKSKDRICEIINIDLPIEVIKKKIKEFKRQATLFISYNREYQELAEAIYKRLSKFDFQIFWDYKSLHNGDFSSQINKSLGDVTSNGFIIALMNDRILSQTNWTHHEIKNALAYDKVYGENSVLPFVINEELVNALAKDKELFPLADYSIRTIKGSTLDEQCDMVVNQILQQMLTPGTILAHVRNFEQGIDGINDVMEAQKLFSLYFDLVDEATKKNNNDAAWRALGRCYEMGWGTPINYEMALSCFRDTCCCSKDIERVILKIRGLWDFQNDKPLTTL